MNTVTVETSARHVHLTEKDIAVLFGDGHQLTIKKMLSQPGEFACEERVDIIGPKKEIKNVIILGPARKATQIEVSLTDARTLGIDAPIRESGDIAGSGACKLVGPAGELELSEGVIVAKRHVHLRPEDAENFGVEDKEIVQVKIENTGRTTIFGDVVIRVRDTFMPYMHIDTDESNACGAKGNNIEGEILTFKTYITKCANCGIEAKVPFKPREDKPVYCSECFKKMFPESDLTKNLIN